MRWLTRGIFLQLVSVILLVPSAPAAAQESTEAENSIRYGLSTGVEYSDNVGRSEAFQEAETSLLAGMFMAIQYERERLAIGLNADVRFQTHSYRDYSNSLLGGAAGNASYRIFRDKAIWVVEDNLGKGLIESRNADRPDNTQDLNVFGTGPDFAIPLGQHTVVQLQGRWTTVSYEKSEYGNNRLAGSAGLAHRLGAYSEISLGGSVLEVHYKELPTISDYDIRAAYVAWQAGGGKTTLNLRAGYSTVEEQQESTGSAMVDLNLTRRLGARTTISLNAGRGFGDSSDILKREQGIRGVSVGDRPAAVSSDPQKSDYATVSWTRNGPRGALTVAGNWRREEHLRIADLDRRTAEGVLRYTRTVSARFTMDFHADYLTENFPNSAIEFDEWGAGFGLSWEFRPTVSMSAGYDHRSSHGDSALGQGTRDFTENRISLHMTWSPER